MIALSLFNFISRWKWLSCHFSFSLPVENSHVMSLFIEQCYSFFKCIIPMSPSFRRSVGFFICGMIVHQSVACWIDRVEIGKTNLSIGADMTGRPVNCAPTARPRSRFTQAASAQTSTNTSRNGNFMDSGFLSREKTTILAFYLTFRRHLVRRTVKSL